MTYYRRLTSGFHARLEHLLGQIENHDALVASALADVRRATGRARGHLSRVQRRGAALRTKTAEVELAEQTWRARAKAVSGDDERALECLRRSCQARSEAAALRKRLAEHEKVEAVLTQEVSDLEQRAAVLQDKHQHMRTREACAEAALATGLAGDGVAREITDAFDRWELRLAEAEGSLVPSAVDELKDAFETEEELAMLQQELATLRGEA